MLPIGLPIVLPVVLSIVLPIVFPLDRFGIILSGCLGPGPDRLGFGLGGQGSWAGPAWVWLGGPRVLGRTGLVLAWGAKGPGPDRLGFGLGTWVGGGERDNFMYLYHNFSLSNQKRMLKPFVHTSFSIRVFWERRDM